MMSEHGVAGWQVEANDKASELRAEAAGVGFKQTNRRQQASLGRDSAVKAAYKAKSDSDGAAQDTEDEADAEDVEQSKQSGGAAGKQTAKGSKGGFGSMRQEIDNW